MEIEGSLLAVGLCPVSAITQESNENHIAFLERLRGPPKVYQSGLRLLQGTGDFKGQISVLVCIRHQDKITTTAAGPSASSDEMVQTATNNFHSEEQEREAKAQEREKRKETSHAQMLAALQGNPMANPKSLNHKG